MNVTIDHIRAVAWDQNHRWQVEFSPAPPAPFSNWFPALDLNHDHGSISTFTVQAGVQDIEIPLRTGSKSLSITFLDSGAVLERWLEDWRSKSMFPKSGNVATLATATRRLSYIREDSWRDRKMGYDLMVFPTGGLQVLSNESPTLKVIQQTFSVVRLTPHGREPT